MNLPPTNNISALPPAGKKKMLQQPDWVFLIFLLLVCNQAMLLIKLVAFAFIYLVRPNFRLGLLKGRLPLFYVLLPAAGLVSWLLHISDVGKNYGYAFCVAAVSWLLCLGAAHQIKLSLEKKGAAAMDATLRLFMGLHFLTCVGQLVLIGFKTNHLNPYDARVPFPYGMSSGDHVFGVLFENSTYNVMVSMMLMIYFLFKGNHLFALLAALCVLLVFSNFCNLVYAGLLLTLLVLTVFKKLSGKASRQGHRNSIFRFIPPQKSLGFLVLLVALLPVFYAVFSPQNFDYFVREKDKVTQPVTMVQADTAFDPISRTRYAKTALPLTLWQQVEKLDFRKYRQFLTVEVSERSRDFENRKRITKATIEAMAGKKLSFMETLAYLKSDVRAMLVGAGMGRFSSLAAHRISGGDTGRIFRKIPVYKTPLYHENHGMITRYRLAAPPAQFATTNWPESFYNQLAGEYGLLGILIFVGFYMRHFLRKGRKISYGLWAAVIMVPFAIINYLFEALCPIVILETLLETDSFETVEQAS